ncbi:MAG: hypothetical protein R3E31_30805 [Chloroflexota bacterium]|nr:hypothetical protein [Anaerolineales bacterium]MCB8966925.1 hypothetical protein [Ardenticatenaceae bacterium]
MKWTDKVKALLRTAVSDLFSEETHPTTPDRVQTQVEITQARLNVLHDEVALTVARAKRAQQAWQTALAANQPNADVLQAEYEAYRETAVSLQTDLAHLQKRLDALRRQHAGLAERDANVTTQETLHTLRRDVEKTADSLHDELAERQESIAQREDHAAARAELRARLSRDPRDNS